MNKTPQTSYPTFLSNALKGRRLTISLYMAAVFLYWVALYLYVPTLPLYVQSKVDNLASVGVILSMYGLLQLVIRLPVGIAADWLGWRKPFIIIGLLLSALGAWLLGASDSQAGLLLGRGTTGLAAATWVPFLAVFSTLFPPHEAVRASALLTLASSFGRLLSMAVTGWLNRWGGYSLAFFLAAGAAVLAIPFMWGVGEQRKPAKRPSWAGIGRLVTRRDVLLPAALNGIGQYAEWSAIFGFLPILARQMGASDVTQSMLMTVYIGVMTLGNLAATTVTRRTGVKPAVYAGFILVSAGLLVPVFTHSIFFLFVAYGLAGLAFGVAYPMLMGMSIRHVADAERATAMGLHQAVYAVGMFSGPWLSGMLAEAFGIRPTLGFTAVLCLVLGVAGTRWLKE